jgi:hypothetical protein
MASLAFSVLEIDGVPIPGPSTEAQIESVIDRLGDEGLAIIADTMKEELVEPYPGPQVGNLPGTPS